MRRHDREITDNAEIIMIAERSEILHLGLFDGEYPYVLPLHYGFEVPEGERLPVFYMHGANEGRKLDIIRDFNKVCIEIECDLNLVSGGNVPCAYGATYRSLIGFGKAEIVENIDEKIHGLELLMQHQTGRPFEINEKMASTVSVIKVTLDKLSGKSRKLSK